MSCGCVAFCRTCGARILWAVVGPKKKTMPLDATPVPGGNIRLTDKVATVMTAEEKATFKGPTYVTHFATCPQAAQHRRKA